ncbi:hypothetical protein [Rhodococcus opacus]|uniref:hypothetical protein n=1 Tax=Rhodococcus opacus TaxID=37919 RepID=UPI0039E7589B
MASYGSFRCGDGFVQIAVGSEAIWRSSPRLKVCRSRCGESAATPSPSAGRSAPDKSEVSAVASWALPLSPAFLVSPFALGVLLRIDPSEPRRGLSPLRIDQYRSPASLFGSTIASRWDRGVGTWE